MTAARRGKKKRGHNGAGEAVAQQKREARPLVKKKWRENLSLAERKTRK